MNLYQEILREILENEKIEATSPNLNITAKEIEEIIPLLDKGISSCQAKVCVFERWASNGGSRHDF